MRYYVIYNISYYIIIKKMSTLILTIGIPGSGKTTIRNLFPSNVIIISPDDLIGYTKNNPWTPQAARNAWIKSESLLKEALKEDNIIIFDATFITAKKRIKYIKMAYSRNAKVIAICCKVSLGVALYRNSLRNCDRRIPHFVIENMHKRLEFPNKEEGFNYILTFDTEIDNISDIKYKIGGFLNDK